MNTIPLTQGRVAIVDSRDFEWLSKWKWHFTFYGYAARRDGKRGTMLYMHREILGLKRGEMGDHANMDRLDNRRDNIRKCDKAQNSINRPLQENNTSGFRGVIWSKRRQKWIARMKHHGKQIHVGTFDTPEIAAAAYDRVMVCLHGSFARPNFQGGAP
jgi:AP2 domain-containing protein